jgi:hypothetical protein
MRVSKGLTKLLLTTLILMITTSSCGLKLVNEQSDDWFASSKTKPYVIIDRLGHPTVTEFMIPISKKSSFNQSAPHQDLQEVRLIAIDHVTEIRTNLSSLPEFNLFLDKTTAELAVDTMIPDVLTLDPTQSQTYPNGRKLEDDAVDVGLKLLLDLDVDDGVQLIEDFSTSFPFLALDHE